MNKYLKDLFLCVFFCFQSFIESLSLDYENSKQLMLCKIDALAKTLDSSLVPDS